MMNTTHFLNVDMEGSHSIDLYYEDQGIGTPIIFIHGFPQSTAAWEKQIPTLLKAGYRTVAYDRRGFGKSSQPNSGYDYDTFAKDLNCLITRLDLHNVILVGHSMGTGEIARYLSIYGSLRVSKAVFISPIPPFLLKTEDNPDGLDQKIFDEIIIKIQDDRLGYFSEFFSDFYNLDLTLDKLVTKKEVAANLSVASKASVVATEYCVSSWLTDFRKDLPKVSLPSLIIQGSADRILPFSVTGKRLHKTLKDNRLVVIEEGSHGIPWTHAKEINNELLNFLK